MFQTHKEVLNYDQCFNIKENRFIRRRRLVRNSGSESALKQGRNTNCTAAALRAKDCVMKTATTIQENAEDILAEAEQINEKRAAEEAAAVQADESGTEDNGAEAGSTETV